MSPKKQKQKHRNELGVTFDCPCGRKHKLKFSLGELQVMLRAVCKGKSPTFNIRHVIFEPAVPSVLPEKANSGELCPICGDVYLIDHELLGDHGVPKYECLVCKQSFGDVLP